jgi:hypothetical protein
LLSNLDKSKIVHFFILYSFVLYMMVRYIDNRVLNACVRPQLPKWCGPTTVSEVLSVLLKKNVCPHEVVRLMSWTPETVVKGFGTSAILKAIQKLSNKRIKYQILPVSDADALWSTIKRTCKKTELLYLHERGHHVLIAGFIEEPCFTFDEFKEGVDCQTSLAGKLPVSPSHPISLASQKVHRILIKAEHNCVINKANDLLVFRDFDEVVNELFERSDRLHLVRLYL